MKHLRLYESVNRYEKFFKEKINWKFFNYLIYKATEFEDAGYTSEINVVMMSNITNYYNIYYKGDDGIYVYRKDQKIDIMYNNIVNDYYNEGLAYSIQFFDSEGMDIDELKEKYATKVKSHAWLMDTGVSSILLVQPLIKQNETISKDIIDNAYMKDVQYVDDILLRFEDTGELKAYYVDFWASIRGIQIELYFNGDDTYTNDGSKTKHEVVIENIIDRLKVKYSGVRQYEINKIMIYLNSKVDF